MEKELEFKKELKALLEKYKADIYALMDGDTHGVSVEIVIDVDNKEVLRTNGELSYRDIKTN